MVAEGAAERGAVVVGRDADEAGHLTSFVARCPKLEKLPQAAREPGPGGLLLPAP